MYNREKFLAIITLLLAIAFFLIAFSGNHKSVNQSKINPAINVSSFFLDLSSNQANIFDVDQEEFQTKVNQVNYFLGKYAAQYGVDSREVFAIIAPELLRYTEFRNFLETSVLETAYIHQNEPSIDFSIGWFQMKPSFIEQLELKSKEIAIDITAKNKEERINRLKDVKWQIKYACIFYKYLDYKYKEHPFKTTEEKLKHFSTHYNLGFNQAEKTITEWKSKKYFPYGKKHGPDQFSYSEVALLFYKSLITKL